MMGDAVERCPSCQGESSVIGYVREEDIYQCDVCELGFIGEDGRKLGDDYGVWYSEDDGIDQDLIDASLRDTEEMYLRQLKVLEKYTDGKSILDVGCGLGIFLAVAKKAGWEVFGSEYSEHAAKIAKKFFSIDFYRDLDEAKKRSYDVVRISHVLEHVADPRGFIQPLFDLLKPGGLFVVYVPNREPLVQWLVNSCRRIVTKKPKLAGQISPYMHLLGFSVGSLKQLVTSFGFEVIDIFTISMGNRTYLPAFYDGLLRKTRPDSIANFFRYWCPLFAANLGNSFNRGENIIAYFRKKSRT